MNETAKNELERPFEYNLLINLRNEASFVGKFMYKKYKNKTMQSTTPKVVHNASELEYVLPYQAIS